LQTEIFAGRIIVRTTVKIHWRDPNDPNPRQTLDLGVVEFEFRKFPQRRWLFISYEDWRLIRIEATAPGLESFGL
ncbi:MAG: hypothetical protein NZU74_20455, partial [Chloroflexaceae bacterium]|nr:hypothetical protein [Chloroflexaceae bacterium]